MNMACVLSGVDGDVRGFESGNPGRYGRCPQKRQLLHSSAIGAAIIVEFRDEVYASVERLMHGYGIVTHRARSAAELSVAMVRHRAELVLLSATQPDESAWLTSAKLRIIDSYRSVWIYTPQQPGALDEWLSMAGADDVIVYGGVLHSLIDSLQFRLGLSE
ncbi:hypothetical protein [Aeoliella sp.]|uniref:hypothetical protein n=1 Tax=Aeoliella sp. TaxID=2795800 RepID=UPI003CCB9DF0